jgi:hypothetical protein
VLISVLGTGYPGATHAACVYPRKWVGAGWDFHALGGGRTQRDSGHGYD